MKKYRGLVIVILTVIGLVAVGVYLLRETHFDLFSVGGEVARQERDILIFTLALSGVVVIPVFMLLGTFSWRYRENGGRGAYQPEWEHNKALEFIWWGIPILIIMTLAVVAFRSSHALDPYRPISGDAETIEVQVVALQWKWLFIYPDLGVATVNHLVIPERTPVHFTIGADAPMSAFWIPALGSQIYAMNGMSTQLHLIADKPGKFPGYNTNINGEGYARMIFETDVRTMDGFDEWVSQTASSTKSLDDAAYAEIEQPSLMEQRAYRFDNHGLYDRIIEKYMPPGMMEGHSHGMHSMEDM